jgi:NTE family protein
VPVAEADFIVGTSAGSIVGSQLARGRDPQSLYEAQLAIAERPQGGGPGPIDMAPVMAQFIKLFSSDAPLQELRAEIGAFALAAKGDETEWVAGFTASEVAGDGSWPSRPFACTAVDVSDGRFVVWDNDAGAPLGLAVASSCAVPGIVPPVTINGRRYMDGGVGSVTNATVANGYDKVLVVSIARPGSGRVGAMPELAERYRKRFEDELAAVRASGSAVELIAPDDEFAREFGANLMDFTKRRQAAEMGLRQGKLEAARIRAFWG